VPGKSGIRKLHRFDDNQYLKNAPVSGFGPSRPPYTLSNSPCTAWTIALTPLTISCSKQPALNVGTITLRTIRAETASVH
jgi:hypothetical protein